jgi:hypothetical protein
VDVYALANVFENFRMNAFRMYEIDPSHYCSTPSFAWDAALKFTNIKLELFTNVEMHSFIEEGIRGGVASVGSIRYVDLENKEETINNNSTIKYFDVNNLYGFCMQKALPVGGFEWVDDFSKFMFLFQNNQSVHYAKYFPKDVGYILLVDLIYSETLANFHIDFPLAAEHFNNRLCLTTNKKNNYVIHMETLLYYLEKGLVLSKIHKIMKFNQKVWLKTYIEKNTEERNKAKQNNDKARADFFKLMNLAVYGKTMENVKKRIDFKLVNNTKEYLKHANNFYIKRMITFSNRLVGIHIESHTIQLTKPIYLGFTILEFAKLTTSKIFYDYIYDETPKINRNNVISKKSHLLYTDTDSFIVYYGSIKPYNYDDSGDWYKFSDEEISEQMMKVDSVIDENELGKIKDEYIGKEIIKFAALRAKSYAIKVKGEEDKVMNKGVPKVINSKIMYFDEKLNGNGDLISLISSAEDLRLMAKFSQIKSISHNIFTLVTEKVAISKADSKKFYLPKNPKYCLPWGHPNIEKFI